MGGIPFLQGLVRHCSSIIPQYLSTNSSHEQVRAKKINKLLPDGRIFTGVHLG